MPQTKPAAEDIRNVLEFIKVRSAAGLPKIEEMWQCLRDKAELEQSSQRYSFYINFLNTEHSKPSPEFLESKIVYLFYDNQIFVWTAIQLLHLVCTYIQRDVFLSGFFGGWMQVQTYVPKSYPVTGTNFKVKLLNFKGKFLIKVLNSLPSQPLIID